MYPNLHKVLLTLAKEIETIVTQKVTDRLRASYEADITKIVKECLNHNDLYTNSAGGWITIKNVAKKYNLSIRTVGEHLTLFKTGEHMIERKWVGRHNMINEKQFMEAFGKKGRKPRPAFLNRKKIS